MSTAFRTALAENTHARLPHPSEPVGRHLLLDLWGAYRLDEIDVVRAALTEAAAACGATLLELKLHPFGEGQGITGVALLAESHISIHTWPEHQYAAVDVFVCGPCDPRAAVPVLEAAFRPQRILLTEQRRGIPPSPDASESRQPGGADR